MAVTGGKIAQIPVSVPNPLLLDVSSDGSSLLILKVTTGDQANPVLIVRTLGGFTRRLGEAQDASFSTDGNTVVYSTPQGEIWLARSDGSEAHKLASVGGDVLDIALSPDGSSIRFTRGNTIWQMSPGESAPHKLLPSLPASSRQCCGRWSRDGKFFLFLSEAEGFEAEFESEIWALDERRGLLRRPPTEPVKLAGAPFSWGRPILSNDGKSIFAEGQAKRGELSRFDAQTKQFVPFLGGISAQGDRLLQRRQVDSLCFLPRRHPVEGQPGRQRPHSTERTFDVGFPASLVARQQTDCVYRLWIARALDLETTSCLQRAIARPCLS